MVLPIVVTADDVPRVLEVVQDVLEAELQSAALSEVFATSKDAHTESFNLPEDSIVSHRRSIVDDQDLFQAMRFKG